MISLFLSFFVFEITCRASYERSLFGRPGTDEVENEWVDGIEILETNLPIPQRKHIKDASFSKTKIPDDAYPYPGHNINLDYWPAMREETNSIINKYNNNVNIRQEDMYWHPVAAQTYYTTQSELDAADRVKIRFTVQPKYTRHILPATFPPGEVVTVEIPEGAKNIITLNLNQQCKTFDGETPTHNQRIGNPRAGFLLNQTVNKVGSPYGGSCTISGTITDPIDIIFSGVILQPYFYYGMTSDEEWENDLSKRPGPFVYLDTGNLVHLGYSKQARNSYRLNDCMLYWRSALQIAQTTALDHPNYGNSRYGRIHNPCIINYETFVPYGAACSYTTTNHIQAPPSWITTSIVFDNAINVPWGTIHEINHQHQTNWGRTSDYKEMTNNAINLVVFAKTNIASSPRLTSGWARFSYASFGLNSLESALLSRYSTMLHFFGVDKFKDFATSDQLELYYPRKDYGIPGSEMLRASKACNRDMRYHWNFYGTSDATLNNCTGDVFGELRKLNLKPFHPVSTVYAVGQVVDGKDVITARPYRIIPIEQRIDFVSTMVQRENKAQFGDFEYQSCKFEPGRESSWKEVKKGVFYVTPKPGLTDIEEVRVNYLDKTTNEVHIVICQFTTMHYNEGFSRLIRLGKIPETENDIFKAYKYISTSGTDDNVISIGTSDGIASPEYTNTNVNNWIAIKDGRLKPSTTGSYSFSATCENQALFYLSENPLKGDPDLDADKLLNYQPRFNLGYESSNKSKPVELSADKFYYFRHVLFPNDNKKGRAWVGYKLNDQGQYVDVPKSWIYLREFTEKDRETVFNNQFHPDFERIYGMDEWTGRDIIANSQDNWNVYKYPRGDCIINSHNSQGSATSSLTPTMAITDGDDTTEYRVSWWPSNKYTPFPHIFEIDMGYYQTFSVIKLKGTGNNVWFGMKTYFQIYLAPSNFSVDENIPYERSNYSINHQESLIWEGFFDTAVQDRITLNNEVSGRYMKLVFLNNSQNWKDNNPGRTDIATLEVGYPIKCKKIYPITNTRYFIFENRWDEYRGGAYYNGKGKIGYAKMAAPSKDNIYNSKLTIKIPKSKSEIAIIGDYFKEMGTAVVKIDDQYVGVISKDHSLDKAADLRKLTKAKHSYKSLLFYYRSLDPSSFHTMTIEVIEGHIVLAGILAEQKIVDYFTDDGTYEFMIKHEFDGWPEPTVEPAEPTNDQPVSTPSLVTPIPSGFNENTKTENIESKASVFEIFENGYKSNENNEMKETPIDKTKESIKTVTFSEKHIKINEAGTFDSNIPLYFTPSQEGSTIEIDKDFKNSNIGILTNNSPTLKAFKSDVPISILNNISTGSITIDVPDKDAENGELVRDVNLKEISNFKGSFTIFVPPTINTVSISTISLFKESKIDIVAKVVRKILSSSSSYSKLQVNNLLNIASKSKSTLYNVEIDGTLAVYDDSSLALDKASKFTKNSEIKLTIKNSKHSDSPIIYVEDSLDSIPSLIVLLSSKTINVANLSIIGSKSFAKCENLISRISFQKGKKGSISAFCAKNENEVTSLYITAKEKKMLDSGAIAGIVIAVILAIVIIAIAIVILIKKLRTPPKYDNSEAQTPLFSAL